MRRAGHHADAIALLTKSATQLRPGPQPSDVDVATYGTLLCTAACASAQAGNRGDAETFMAETGDAAVRISGPVTAGEITFSPANVAVYNIGVFTALGDSATALEHAGQVDVHQLDASERYARYCIDTARAWEQHGHPDRATHALCAAESVAPEELLRPSSYPIAGLLPVRGTRPAPGTPTLVAWPASSLEEAPSAYGGEPVAGPGNTAALSAPTPRRSPRSCSPKPTTIGSATLRSISRSIPTAAVY